MDVWLGLNSMFHNEPLLTKGIFTDTARCKDTESNKISLICSILIRLIYLCRDVALVFGSPIVVADSRCRLVV
jgi:hypothetical protein